MTKHNSGVQGMIRAYDPTCVRYDSLSFDCTDIERVRPESYDGFAKDNN